MPISVEICKRLPRNTARDGTHQPDLLRLQECSVPISETYNKRTGSAAANLDEIQLPVFIKVDQP